VIETIATTLRSRHMNVKKYDNNSSAEGLALPLRIVTSEGTFHSGWTSRELADKKLAELNKAATDLGLAPRYKIAHMHESA
jgi:hypothetical protein